ncbi:hypothetical protein CR513_51501, partial [Mucuna pruriens]
MIGLAKLMRGSYHLNSPKNEFNKEQVSFTVNNNVYSSMTIPESSLWHFKLGHASNSQLEKLCKQLSYVHINKNENKYNVAVKKIRNDNGPEFIIDSFYATKGIFHQTSCVETSQQNGKAERKHQHVLNGQGITKTDKI